MEQVTVPLETITLDIASFARKVNISNLNNNLFSSRGLSRAWLN